MWRLPLSWLLLCGALLLAWGAPAQIAGFPPGTFSNRAALSGGGSPPPPATTTWNPADKSAGMTLSNGNLTATWVSGVASCVRSVATHSTGKYHFEWTVNSVTSTAGFGIASLSASLALFAGQSDTLGFTMNSSHFYYYNAGSNNLGPATFDWHSGDVLVMEVDFDGMTGDVQNFTQGSGYHGSIDISATTGSPWAVMFCALASPTEVVANFGGSAYAVAPTAGYGNF